MGAQVCQAHVCQAGNLVSGVRLTVKVLAQSFSSHPSPLYTVSCGALRPAPVACNNCAFKQLIEPVANEQKCNLKLNMLMSRLRYAVRSHDPFRVQTADAISNAAFVIGSVHPSPMEQQETQARSYTPAFVGFLTNFMYFRKGSIK